MNTPKWVAMSVVMAIHEAQLAEHGGRIGVRDQGLLESALARPQQIFAYTENPALVQLAAAYAFGIGRNRAFVDGIQRTAWVVCAVFLELNSLDVFAGQPEVAQMMLGVAEGSITEASFAAWLERNSR